MASAFANSALLAAHVKSLFHYLLPHDAMASSWKRMSKIKRIYPTAGTFRPIDAGLSERQHAPPM